MKRGDWYFVHLSDPQFGMFRPGAAEYLETPLAARAIARVNALRPAFVLCTGDLVDVPRSDDQLAHARGMLEALDPDVPFLPVPGNHDVGDAPAREDLRWYRGTVGRDRLSFNHRGWHFAGINSCLLADGSAAPGDAARQWAWLEEDLARPAARRAEGTVVFMHHPPFLEDEDEDDGYFNLPRAPRRRLLEILRRAGVRLVLCGHLHRSHATTAADPEIVVSGPVGMPLGEGFSGLRLVAVRDGSLRHGYFALDDVAGQESFLGMRHVGNK